MTLNNDLFRYTLATAIAEIKTFQKKAYNWDGYGALPLQKRIARKGIVFLKTLDPIIIKNLSSIRHYADGTLIMHWKYLNDAVSVEFGEEWENSWMYVSDLVVHGFETFDKADEVLFNTVIRRLIIG